MTDAPQGEAATAPRQVAAGDVALSHVAMAAATRVAGDLRVDRPRKDGRHIPGEAGVWVFIFGDMTTFVVYLGVFVASRNGAVGQFRRSQAALHQSMGAVNTLVLLVSSLLVVFAARSASAGARPRASRLFVAAAGCGVAFIGLKITEYALLFHDQRDVGGNTFFRYYLTLTGIHLAHVVLGVILLLVLSRVVRKSDPTPGLRVLLEGGACWWHMVDLIWVILFPLVYLAK